MSHHDEMPVGFWRAPNNSMTGGNLQGPLPTVTVTGSGVMGQYDSMPTNFKQTALNEHRRALVVYLRSKTDVEDWHAVADAACDLREIDAKLEMLK